MKKYSEKKLLENFKGIVWGGYAYSIIDGATIYWTYCSQDDYAFCLTEYRDDADSIKYFYEGYTDFRIDYIGKVCRAKEALKVFTEKMTKYVDKYCKYD